MRQLTVMMGGLLLLCVLSACGQKGDLYLPDPPTRPQFTQYHSVV